MRNVINLTPHNINLITSTGEELTIPASGEIARVSTNSGVNVGELNGVALYSATSFGEIEGLPAPQKDTVYIVSGLVGSQVEGRDDVVVPGTGPQDEPVRNEKGHIVAVTRLIKAC